ncbi:MAG: tetratricopeptide repeat protein [Alphaproteobacteria bacterium]|nr:tetratricopeptide repeat protein [Alphaproteobacteria bacterium]
MSFDVMFKQAGDLYLDGAYTQAEKIYRQLLAFTPENADVLNMLGLIAQAKGEHAQAASFFYSALKKALNPLPVLFSLAVSLTALEKFASAAQLYQKILTQKPDLKEAYNNLGGIYEKTGNKKKALECYQKAIDIDSTYLEALVGIALLQKDKQALEELAAHFDQAALPLYYLALAEFDAQNNQKALTYVLKADALDETFEIKNLKAQIYLRLSKYEEAKEAFYQALKLNEKSVDALVNLGIIEKQEHFFKQALSINPDSFEAHISYADFLYADKRTLEALEEYRKAVLLAPDDLALSNNLALILKDLGDYKGALDLFLNAFLKNKDNDAVAVNMAETLVLLHQTEPEAALEVAKLWQTNAPNNLFANRTLASFKQKPTGDDETYAKVLFDSFAQIYDTRMSEIKYDIFKKIKDLKISFDGAVLDLGCGTGLAAQNLKTPKSVWTGVDISSKMLEIARKKDLYQNLYEQDIVDFLTSNHIKSDIVLLLDVLEYTKEFEKIFALCFPAKLILSFEKAPLDAKTFRLSPQGRYQHNPQYIAQILKNAGYQTIKQHPLVLRKENGKDAQGFLFVCS